MSRDPLKNLAIVGLKLIGWSGPRLSPRDRQVLKKNLKLAGKLAGRRVFVVGTGPSIKSQDLKKLAGEVCITVSNFFVHPDFNLIKPTFHLFAPIHSPVTAQQFNDWLKDAEAHFPKGQKVLVSLTDKHIIDTYGRLKKQDVYYYRISSRPLAPSDRLDFSGLLPAIQTSPQIAIYLALYGDAREIIILGCDHDSILNLKVSRHFYNEKESVLSQAGYNEWLGQGQDLGTECEAYVQLWNIYRAIRAFAAEHDISILNATDGGLLDVYPRANYSSIFKQTKKGGGHG
jgi:hypothetical protein